MPIIYYFFIVDSVVVVSRGGFYPTGTLHTIDRDAYLISIQQIGEYLKAESR